MAQPTSAASDLPLSRILGGGVGGQSRSSSLPRSEVKTLVAGVRNFQVAQSVRGRVRACACASESVCTRPVRQSRSARVRTHVCVGVFMCACVSACVRVPVLACVFARACARARVRVCACDGFSVCVSVCVCTCVSALWLPPGVVAWAPSRSSSLPRSVVKTLVAGGLPRD